MEYRDIASFDCFIYVIAVGKELFQSHFKFKLLVSNCHVERSGFFDHILASFIEITAIFLIVTDDSLVLVNWLNHFDVGGVIKRVQVHVRQSWVDFDVRPLIVQVEILAIDLRAFETKDELVIIFGLKHVESSSIFQTLLIPATKLNA